MLAANVLFAAGLYFHAFLYNFYLLELGLRERVLGNAAAALTLGGLIALIPAGLLVDRIGARLTYFVAASLLAAGLAIGAITADRNAIYLSALIAGAGTAAWRVAMGPLLMQVTNPQSRARAFSNNVGLLVASGALWTVVSGAAPGWIRSFTGVTAFAATRAALLIGAAGSLIGVALLFLLPATPGIGAPRAPNLRDAFRVPPRLMLIVLMIAVWMTASGLVIPFFNLLFHREHDMPLERVASLFAISQLLAAAAIFISGAIASRFGARRMLWFWSLLFAPLLWALAAAGSLVLAAVLYVVQGIVAPATNALIDQLLMERAAADQRGRISSWRNAATEGSGFAGASLGGRLLEIGAFPLLLSTAGVIALFGAFGLNLILRPQRTAVASPGDPTAQQPKQHT